MQYFIDIILPIPLEKLFTYSITKAESNFLKPGIRVAVPFGKSKIYTGLVYKIHSEAPVIYDAKEIHQILDEEPIVNSPNDALRSFDTGCVDYLVLENFWVE